VVRHAVIRVDQASDRRHIYAANNNGTPESQAMTLDLDWPTCTHRRNHGGKVGGDLVIGEPHGVGFGVPLPNHIIFLKMPY
jgi:hypothetical protein